jgi:hypothetical protein
LHGRSEVQAQVVFVLAAEHRTSSLHIQLPEIVELIDAHLWGTRPLVGVAGGWQGGQRAVLESCIRDYPRHFLSPPHSAARSRQHLKRHQSDIDVAVHVAVDAVVSDVAYYVVEAEAVVVVAAAAVAVELIDVADFDDDRVVKEEAA